MKRTLILFAMILTLSVPLAHAGDPVMSTHQGSADFEKLKNLAGTWEGASATTGQQAAAPVTVEYAVSSNGSILLEKLMPGTPHEMVTVYYERGGKIHLTHYCAVGNQPRMDLASHEDNTFNFSFSDSSDIDPAQEAHMHALTLELNGDNNLTQHWTFFKDGKAVEIHSFQFIRKK